MSDFSDVDRSGRAEQLVGYLDAAHGALLDARAMLLAGLDARAGDRVLDLGCGTGQELLASELAGQTAVGLDASAVMLGASRERLVTAGQPARLVQADAGRLPFADGVFDAARVERVLQHVEDPALVVRELRRVIRPGGSVALMEPDWTSLHVESDDEAAAGAITGEVGATLAQPRIGRELHGLLTDAGFADVRGGVEQAHYATLDELRQVLAIDRTAERAVTKGAVTRSRADDWLAELAKRSADGTFAATLDRSVLAWGTAPAG